MQRPPLGTKKIVPSTHVVFICRFNNRVSIPLGTCKCGLYKQVVYIEVVFTGLLVYAIVCYSVGLRLYMYILPIG